MRTRFVALALGIILSLGAAALAFTEKTVTIAIDGMHCDKCAASVAKKLKATEGVQEAAVSFDTKEATVKYDDAKVSVEKLKETIKSTGFKVKS
ncbi:MAG: heavy metal-associated domain-containing protein [Pyrinomonadaceae bacterium]